MTEVVNLAHAKEIERARIAMQGPEDAAVSVDSLLAMMNKMNRAERRVFLSNLRKQVKADKKNNKKT